MDFVVYALIGLAIIFACIQERRMLQYGAYDEELAMSSPWAASLPSYDNLGYNAIRNDDDDDVFECLRGGAAGYLLKDSPPDKLVEAIRAVARGESFLQPSITAKVLAELGRLEPQERPPPTLPEPLSDRELEILRVLWELGPSSVRDVYNILGPDAGVGYTTVLKLMQIMTDKGLVERDTSVRPQLFWAARPQRQTQRMLLRRLLDRAFSGSPGSLVLQALAMRKSTPEELAEIRRLLDRLEEKGS